MSEQLGTGMVLKIPRVPRHYLEYHIGCGNLPDAVHRVGGRRMFTRAQVAEMAEVVGRSRPKKVKPAKEQQTRNGTADEQGVRA